MFKKLTKVLTFALVIAMMVTSMASCNWFKCTEHVDENGDFICDRKNCGAVIRLEGNYTYNTYLSDFPNQWNPHTYETSTDSEILDYTTLGFYSFDFNEAKDGFVIVPEMATKMPVDVTADYVGEWGIEEGDASKAWLVEIRDDLKWETGERITANDFVESAKRLLDPKAINHRADSLYSGDLAIVGAKNYFYSGRTVKNSSTMIDSTYTYGYEFISDLTVGDKGQLYNADGAPLWFNINSGCVWSSNSLTAYYNAGYLKSVSAVNEAYGALIKIQD